MSISSNTIVTSAGIDLATSAHDSGPLIAIKYFLPSYDYRIDPYMFTSVDEVMDLSASMSASDTQPYGEIIYNIDADNYSYELSDSTYFIVSGGTPTDQGSFYTVENPLVTDKYKINLYDGIPLSNYISGSDMVYDSNDYPNTWKVYDYGVVSGDNSVPAEVVSNNDRFFNVTDYYPVSADGGALKGSWKCRLSKNIGNVKFNKLGLYAVQLDNDGNETSSPVLFAEASLSEPITKTNFGADGFDDIVIDVQIQMVSVIADFSDVFYSTSGDYWARTVGGLYYSEKIGIGTFNDGLEEPDAKVEIKDISNQLALTYDNDNKVYFSVGTHSSGYTTMSISPKSADYGALDIDFGWNANLSSVSVLETKYLDGFTPHGGRGRIVLQDDIYPEENNDLYLGSATYQFARAYINSIRSQLGYIEVESSLLPITTDLYNLGSGSKKWNYVYANNINVYNTINTKEINITENLIANNINVGDASINHLEINDFNVGEWIDGGGLAENMKALLTNQGAGGLKYFALFSSGLGGETGVVIPVNSSNNTVIYSVVNNIVFIKIRCTVPASSYYSFGQLYLYTNIDELKPNTEDIDDEIAVGVMTYFNGSTIYPTNHSVFTTNFNSETSTNLPQEAELPCFRIPMNYDFRNSNNILTFDLSYRIS